MNKKSLKIYSLAFILPIVVLLIYMCSAHIFPYGNRSFLYWDSDFQYLNYYSYLKSTLTTNNNLFYSLSNLGGNNMFDFSAYYNFFSPFNIIFFIFPEEYLNIALQILMLIKIGLCSVTFAYFINKEVKESYYSVFFGLSYALCEHTLITTMSNFILMDGILLLPLVAVGISKLVSKEKPLLFAVTLFFTIITNAYMGYVAIVFSLLFFIYKLILKGEKTKQYIISLIKKYLLSVSAAILLNFWLLLPVRYALNNGKYEYFSILGRMFLIKEHFIKVISKLFSCNLAAMFWQDRAPYIFCGILILVFLILYFFNKKYTIKEKIADGVLILFIFLSFFINCLFIIWTMGVEEPNGTLQRFGYIFNFMIIYVAYKSFVEIGAIKTKHIISTFFIFGVMALLVYIKKDPEIGYLPLIGDVIVGILILSSIYFINKLNNSILKNVLISLIMLLHVINIGVNTNFVFTSQKSCCVAPNINKFIDFKKIMQKSLNQIYDSDKDFYRIASGEIYLQPKFVDHLAYNNNQFLNHYDSIAGYSSLGSTLIREFYYNIGIPVFLNNMLFTYTDNVQTLPLSFFGVKYIISSSHEPEGRYQKIHNIDGRMFVYKNPYSFPFAFVLDKSSKIENSNNYNFSSIPKFQNDIVKILSGQDFGDVYEYKKLPIGDIAIKKFDLRNQQMFEEHHMGEEEFMTPVEEPSDREFDPQQHHEHDHFDIDHIYYDSEIVPNNNNTYFLYYSRDFLAYLYSRFHLQVSNLTKTYLLDDLHSNVIYLGFNNKNKVLNVEAFFNPSIFTKEDNVRLARESNYYIAYEDLDVLKKYSDLFNSKKCNIKKITSSHFKGTFKTDQDSKFLFLSIPYDDSWNIKINGKKRKPIKVLYTMMAIPLENGDSEIDMMYIPKGFCIGTIISLSVLIMLLIVAISYRKWQK